MWPIRSAIRRSICRASCASAAAAPTRAAAVSWASITTRSCCRIPKRKPENTQPATRDERYARRLELLEQMEADFGAVEGADIVADHRKLISKSSEMILSPRMEAFDLSQGIRQDARRLRPHARSAPAACWPGGSSKRASRSSKSTSTAGTRTTTTSTRTADRNEHDRSADGPAHHRPAASAACSSGRW